MGGAFARVRGGAFWRAVSRSWWAAAALAVVCGAVYLPGLMSIPPIDRDESRFAQASRQMFESVAPGAWAAAEREARPAFYRGGLVVPMVQETPRLSKPPLVYWLQAASAAAVTGGDASRDGIGAYRLASALCALVAVLATWRLGLRLMDARAALLGAGMLAVSPLIIADAHQARADTLLTACTTLAMAAMWRVWRGWDECRGSAAGPGRSVRHRGGWCWPVLLWLAVGAGVLAKGPVTPMIVVATALTLAALTRRWGLLMALRPLVGAGVVGAMVLPWVLAAASRSGGLGAYAGLVWEEFFARGLGGSREGHWAPPGFHTLLLAGLFWPGSLLTLAGVMLAVRAARGAGPEAAVGVGGRARARGWLRAWTGRDVDLFLLAWLAPSWIIFELSAAKLAHYPMPLYPAVALLSARAVVRLAARRPDAGQRVGAAVWLVLGAAITVAAPLAALRASAGPDAPWTDDAPALLALLASAGLLAGAGWFVLGRWLPVRAVLLAGGAMLCATPVLLGVAAPRWTTLWIAPRVVALADADAHADAGRERSPLWAAGFREDSLVFATRGRVERLAAEAMFERLAALAPGARVRMVVEADDPRLAGGGLSGVLRLLGRVEGFNYANGRRVDVVVVEYVAGPAAAPGGEGPRP